MTEIDSRTAARATEREHAALVRSEFRRIQLKLLEAIEKTTDNVIASQTPARPAAPADVERRTVANVLRLWQFCGRRACNKARACRGEPRHCLQAGISLLPEGTLAALVTSKRRKKKR